MDKKKVLFVATVVKTHINVFHLPYLQWFQEQGYETHVAAKNDFGDEECIIPYCDVHYDIPFERSPISKNNIKSYKTLKKIIDDNKYDIIHCHTPVGAMLTRLAAIGARKRGAKVIYTAHGFHFYKGAPLINWLIYYPVEKICSYFTDILITITKEDYALAKKKMKAKQIEYVPGVGVDTEKFSIIKTDRKEKRKELGIPEGAIMLLSVGELNKNKNHEIVIKALDKIDNTDIYYCIAGQGDLKKDLEDLINTTHMKERIQLLGFRKDVQELCEIADVFVFPSHREGLSVALMEAMATGLPIICSNIRGNVDLVEEGKGGILCKSNSVDDFVSGIEKVIYNKNIVKQMRIYNKEFIKQVDLKNIKTKMNKIYGDIINKEDEENTEAN